MYCSRFFAPCSLPAALCPSSAASCVSFDRFGVCSVVCCARLGRVCASSDKLCPRSAMLCALKVNRCADIVTDCADIVTDCARPATDCTFPQALTGWAFRMFSAELRLIAEKLLFPVFNTCICISAGSVPAPLLDSVLLSRGCIVRSMPCVYSMYDIFCCFRNATLCRLQQMM